MILSISLESLILSLLLVALPSLMYFRKALIDHLPCLCISESEYPRLAIIVAMPDVPRDHLLVGVKVPASVAARPH